MTEVVHSGKLSSTQMKFRHSFKNRNAVLDGGSSSDWDGFVRRIENLTPEQRARVAEAARAPFAAKKGSMMALNCRSPGEAFLVANEVELEDIIPLLPTSRTLVPEYVRTGCVEVL